MGEQSSVTLTDDVTVYLDGAALTATEMDHLLRIEVEQSSHVPSVARISFFDDDDAAMIDNSKFDIGKEIEVKFKNRAASSGTFVSVFKGEIVSLQPEYTEGLQMTMTIIAFDKMHRLNRGRKSRAFLQMSDSDIISKLARESSVTASVASTSTQNDFIAQDNVTNLAFIQMLARRNNFEITCDNGTMNVKARQQGSPVATLTAGQQLLYFRPHLTTTEQVSKVQVKGWDMKTKAAVVGEATSTTSHPSIGYNKTGIAASSTFGDAPWLELSPHATIQAVAAKMAEARLNELNAAFIQCEGRCLGNSAIKPGKLIKLEKLGTRFSGNYVVTVARHVYSDGIYETEFTVEGQQPELVSGYMSPQIDPPRIWNGVVSAVVTNNNDTENLGRIKVKYPWYTHEGTEVESDWIRVASLSAGSSRGFQAIPEVADEVLIAFEHGYFDKPYVIGALWNGVDKPPMQASEFVQDGKIVMQKWKTRTGHEFIFTEKDSDSKIEIKEKDTKLSITMDGSNASFEIKNDKMTITMNDSGITIKSTDKKITIDAGSGNLDIKGATINVEGTGNVNIKGSAVNIN